MRAAAGTPLIVLIHGLTGCEDSTYVRQSARFHLMRGRRVLRLNLRGAGPGRELATGYYHVGCAPDFRDMLAGLTDEDTRHGVFAVGYSLGGNILLNLLGSLPTAERLVGAAVVVSAPIEPREACQRIMAARNALYHRWLLRRMKQDVLASPGLTSAENWSSATKADFNQGAVSQLGHVCCSNRPAAIRGTDGRSTLSRRKASARSSSGAA